MDKLLDQFKYLNPKDPGTWPALPKLLALIATLAALVAVGYVADWQGQMDELVAGADGLELNLSCPHMDRPDMGSNIGKDQALCSFVTKVVKEAVSIPVWAKLTPATSDIVQEAGAVFRGGGDAVCSSNTFPSLPLIDPDTLEFEVNVDGCVSSGGLGGPAILPLSLAKMAEMTRVFPDKAFSGVGGISEFAHALNYFLLGCGTVQVCTAAMLDHAIGPNVIKRLIAGYREFLDRNAHRGWTTLEDFRGVLRDRVVAQSKIRRPDRADYQGGYEPQEGYAEPEAARTRRSQCPPSGGPGTHRT